MNKYITYLEVAAFVACLVAIPKFKGKPHLLVFPWLLLIIVLVEGHQTFFKIQGVNNTAIYNIQIPLQHLLYLLILYLSFETPKYRRVTLALLAFFILVTALTSSHYFTLKRSNIISYSLGSLFIVGATLMKFFEMLKSPIGSDFLRDPFFYILFAFLIFNVGTLPRYTMGNWLYSVNNQYDMVQVFTNVSTVLNYLLYTTYTAAFLWIRAKKDSY